MINWTQNVEENFGSDDDGRKADFILEATQNDGLMRDLNDIIRVIRDISLDQIQRKKLTALITHEVHNRDIIEDLINHNLTSTDNFAWKKCLRYYMEEE